MDCLDCLARKKVFITLIHILEFSDPDLSLKFDRITDLLLRRSSLMSKSGGG